MLAVAPDPGARACSASTGCSAMSHARRQWPRRSWATCSGRWCPSSGRPRASATLLCLSWPRATRVGHARRCSVRFSRRPNTGCRSVSQLDRFTRRGPRHDPAGPLVACLRIVCHGCASSSIGGTSRPLMPTAADAESNKRPADGSPDQPMSRGVRAVSSLDAAGRYSSVTPGRTVVMSSTRSDRICRRSRLTCGRSLTSSTSTSGAYWQTRIADLIEGSDKVLVIVTDGFWRSQNCLEEYNMALLLHKERQGGVLFPIYRAIVRAAAPP